MIRRVVALAAALSAAAVPASAQERGMIGKPIKEFKLRDATKDGDAWISLADFKGKSPVVLVWISEKCDVTWKYEKRTGALREEFGPKGVQFLAVWSSAADTREGIRKYVESKNYGMPVLDDENGELARYFGAVVTPTYAVIDKEGVLRYVGAMDDLQCGPNYRADESQVKERYVHSVLTALLEGKEVTVAPRKGFG
ncbi:MAG TPA: redoxin domain-containing protein [Planctomycetota bacterium]|nr:redoxin domain-containing protein [Planctomycetota bacterium]